MKTEMDVYDQLADMIVAEDIIGGPKTPAFLRLLSLQFTPAEARLALQVRTAGAKFDEIVEKTGMKKETLQKMLYTMADKGTMYYDSSENPTYRVVQMAAPGLIETGLWGNIKFSFSVELAKAIHQVLKEWSKEKLCTLGMPFAPVWAGLNALPEDATPQENIAEAIKNEGHWSVSPCPCRLSHWIVDPGNHCDHILETCLHTGDLSRWTVKHGMARALTYEQVVEFLKNCNNDGLVQTLNIQNCICNCCNDCCAIFYGHNLGTQVFVPSPFIAKVDEETCTACEVCAKRCPVNAIVIDKTASIKKEVCLGCGVCVPSCQQGAMRLGRRS